MYLSFPFDFAAASEVRSALIPLHQTQKAPTGPRQPHEILQLFVPRLFRVGLFDFRMNLPLFLILFRVSRLITFL